MFLNVKDSLAPIKTLAREKIYIYIYKAMQYLTQQANRMSSTLAKSSIMELVLQCVKSAKYAKICVCMAKVQACIKRTDLVL